MKTAEEIGRASIERLALQRKRQQLEAAELHEQIKRLALSDAGPYRGLAKRILSRLPEPRPSLRTVQWHLKRLRNALGIARSFDTF